MKSLCKKIIKCFVPYGVVALHRRKLVRIKARERAQKAAYQKAVDEGVQRRLSELDKAKAAYEDTLKEEQKSYGLLNPDKTFYISRRPAPGAGLFSNYHWVLGNVMYALGQGYIPVIDMENYKTYYNESEPINRTYNAWEYYFEQPFPYTLEEVYQSKNVILGSMMYMEQYICPLSTQEQIECYNALMTKYLRFNETTRQAIKEVEKKTFNGRKNILGVAYRGTDLVKMHLPFHPIIAPLEDYIQKTRQFMSEWNMEYVYISTEEVETVEAFKNAFGDKLIVMDRMRIKGYTSDMGYMPSIKYCRAHDNYKKGLEYIIDTVLLSKCDSLICANTNGTAAAIEFNCGKYKHKYIYSLGHY